MFSILVDCSGAKGSDIRNTISSLQRQAYRNFEIILVGELTPDVDRLKTLEFGNYRRVDKVSVLQILSEPDCVTWRGDYLSILAAGDKLKPTALSVINKYLAQTEPELTPELVIFDHTLKVDAVDRFLPRWDPDLLRYHDYVQRAFCASRGLVYAQSKTGPFGTLSDWLAAVTMCDGHVIHIPELLATLNSSIAPVRPLEISNDTSIPPISVIIPNKNGCDLLPKCVEFLRSMSSPFELIIVDNNSDDPDIWPLYMALEIEFRAKILSFRHSFNYSSMINMGAAAAQHDLMLFLNNDVVIADYRSLQAAISYYLRHQVGVIGSLLRYPDGTVQHAGMTVSRTKDGECHATHILRHSVNDEMGHIGALTAPRNWHCVTGALQIVSKNIFNSVGGYDEALPVEHNDVDFCLRVWRLSYAVVCLPLEGIIHNESQTRSKMDASIAKELLGEARAIVRERWSGEFSVDFFMNPVLQTDQSSATLYKSATNRLAYGARRLRYKLLSR